MPIDVSTERPSLIAAIEQQQWYPAARVVDFSELANFL